MATEDPLAAVAAREARVAIVPALSLFAAEEGEMLPRDGFEAIAVTGTTYVHALARRDGPDALAASGSIATGPPQTPGTQPARVVEAVFDWKPSGSRKARPSGAKRARAVASAACASEVGGVPRSPSAVPLYSG